MARTVIKPVTPSWTNCDIDGVDPSVLARAASAATAYMWALSGRRAGELVTTGAEAYAPCISECSGPVPYLRDELYWVNGSGTQGHPCCRLTLPNQPVRSVQAVRVDGSPLGANEWVLLGNTVMRVNECWPCTDECDPPRISIDFTWGIGFDALGLLALDELACELLAGLSGGACRLSPRAMALTRQGVTIQMGDAAKLMSEGFTGLSGVDAWVRAVNPGRLQERPRIVGVDSGRFV